MATVACWTVSLNTPETVVPVVTDVAPAAGVVEVTVGLVVSAASVVKVQVTGDITLPDTSRVPLRSTVYVVLGASAVVGVSVTVRVVAL